MGVFDRELTPARQPTFAIGHVDFEWTGDAPSPDPLVISPHPRVLHATLVEAPGPIASRFQDSARTRGAWRALCGLEVLVVTPTLLDDVVRWTCETCGSIVSRWLEDVRQVQWELRVPFDH